MLFLDPDSRVYGRLDDVAELAVGHGLVLSPHFVNHPDPEESFRRERGLLITGIFNSGLVGVGPSGAAFLDWWAARLQRWTLIKPDEGFFGVQRWLDLASAMFPHHVISDPGLNILAFNSDERELEEVDGVRRAAGRPLRMFHFNGTFDPTTPYRLSADISSEGLRFSEHPILASVYREYADEFLAAGWEDRPALDPDIELDGGVALDETMRTTYRDALLQSEAGYGSEPPNPYTDGTQAFAEWLRAPSDLRRDACILSRYLQARWQDGPSLQARFPDLLGGDAHGYLAWALDPDGLGLPDSLAASGWQVSSGVS